MWEGRGKGKSEEAHTNKKGTILKPEPQNTIVSPLLEGQSIPWKLKLGSFDLLHKSVSPLVVPLSAKMHSGTFPSEKGALQTLKKPTSK